MRRGDHHPERAGPEAGVVALVRVQPDQPVAEPGQPLHRGGQDGWIPRSRPSEQITTMPPRHRPRRAQSLTNVSRLSPILVPPSSRTRPRGRSRASSGRRHSIAPVTRVSRVPKQNTSTRPADRLAECADSQAAGVVGHGPGDVQDQDQRPQPDLPPPPVQPGRAHRACAGTPGRSGGDRDGFRTWRGQLRLVRRRGGVSRILAMIRRSAASSSGVQAANALCLSASASRAIRPSTASSCSAVLARLGRRHGQRALGLQRRA